MPITKIVKESQLYFEIKAKYESKAGTIQELATEYGLNRQYLTEYAKKEKWERGKQKESPEKQKEALQPFIKETVQKTIELQEQAKQELQPQEKTQFELQKDKARDNAKQVDELTKAITEQFYEDGKIKDFVLSTALLGMHRIRQALLTNKQYYDGKEQQVGLQTSTHYLRMAQTLDTYAGIFGLGMPKGVNFFNQNNNSNQINNQSNETPSIFREALEEIINQDKAIAPKVPKQVEAVES